MANRGHMNLVESSYSSLLKTTEYTTRPFRHRQLNNSRHTAHSQQQRLSWPSEQNQKSIIMKSNVKPLSLISYICLAVILFGSSNVNVVQLAAGNSSPFIFHHSQSNNQSVLFKDHSGPSSGKIQSLDVICGKNFMSVRAEFSAPFYGIVFSKGTFGQENCVYVKPGSGLIHAAFNVYYDQCGTKPDLEGKFYENTIVIQYGSDIIEAYDEAKRLRCEWFEAYEKPASFRPAIPVADLEVVEMNFQGDDIDCWMEIQEGIEPWGRPLNKMVPVGQPMTLVVAINDNDGQFDMRVKSCFAHDGIQKPIALTDEYGCVLRPKMLTTFTKIKNPGFNRNATVLSYSRFLTFKFPDSMSVQIQCTVEVCRNGCADACQLVASKAATNIQSEVSMTAAKPWFSAPSQASGDEPIKRIESTSDLAPNESQLSRPIQIPFNQQQLLQQSPPQQQPSAMLKEAFSGGIDRENYASSQNANQISIAKKQYIPRQIQRQQPMLAPQPAQQIQLPQPQSLPLPAPPPLPQTPIMRLRPQPEVPATQDDTISGSDSNRRPEVSVPDEASQGIHLIPNRQVAVAAPLPPPQPQPAAHQQQSPATTSLPEPEASAESQPGDYNRLGGLEETPELVASDDNLTRLNASNGSGGEEVPPATTVEPERNEQANLEQQQSQQQSAQGDKREQDQQPKSTNGSQQMNGGQSKSSDQQLAATNDQQQIAGSTELPASPSENRPSVQGYNDEDIKPQANGPLVVKSQQVGGAQNSLKTVEVEVPANEDPVQGLMASASANGRPSQFNSVRLSNIESTSNSNNNDYLSSVYETMNQQNKEARQGQQQHQANNKQSSYGPEGVIQPRESSIPSSSSSSGGSGGIERRDKGSVNIEEGSMAVANSMGKSRFGTRSQPIVVNVQGAVEPPARHYNNHQAASAAVDSAANADAGPQSRLEHGDSVGPSAGTANIDRVLTDSYEELSRPTIDLASVSSNSASNSAGAGGLGNDEDAAASVSVHSQSNNESPNKGEFDSMRHRTSAILGEESTAVDLASSEQGGQSKQVKPVVGTDELASGPIQFESRIGASSSDSLEDALTRLQQQQQLQQQQAPQTAALVSSQQPEAQVDPSQASSSPVEEKAERRVDAGQQEPTGLVAGNKLDTSGQNDRLDLSNLLSLVKKQTQPVAAAVAATEAPTAQKQLPIETLAADAHSQQSQSLTQQQKVSKPQLQQQQQSKQEINQPYPNVAGQAKVIPDPGVHGSMLTAQGSTNLASVLPADQRQQQHQQQKQMAASQQQEQQGNKQSSTLSPVSQVPYGLGFSKSHLSPAIQKLSQNLHPHSQQQLQLQQQQQQVKQALTSKPTRGRFSLFSPHVALQAVASRFLSKTDTQQQQQQLQQQAQIPAAIRQQLPQAVNANNVKLSPDREQKLLMLLQQQQVQKAQNLFPAAKQQAQQQQYLQNAPLIAPQQQSQAQLQQWEQQQNQPGIPLATFLQQQQQQQQKQLIRSRRSFVPPVSIEAQANGDYQDDDLADLSKDSTANSEQISHLSGSDLPQIKIRRLVKGDSIYVGVCLPVFSLTFMITCVLWLIVFSTIYGIYWCINSRRRQGAVNGKQ